MRRFLSLLLHGIKKKMLQNGLADAFITSYKINYICLSLFLHCLIKFAGGVFFGINVRQVLRIVQECDLENVRRGCVLGSNNYIIGKCGELNREQTEGQPISQQAAK